MRSFRSRLVLTIVLSALVAAGIGVAIPVLAVSRAEAALEARMGDGSDAHVGGAHVGLSSTTLDDVWVTLAGSEARLVHVTVRASIFALATEGASAVRGVEIDGGTVSVDPASAHARMVPAAGASEGSAVESAGRVVDVRDLALVVRGADGGEPLASARIHEMHWQDGLLTLSADELAIGSDTIGHLELDGARGATTFEVSRLALEQVVVSADVVEGAGPIERLRAAWRGEATAPALSPSSVHDGEDDDDPDDAAPDASPPSRSLAERFAALEEHLGPTFVASVDGLTVRRTVDGAPHDVLAGLEASLRRTSRSGFATEGEGQPEGGGSLSWRLDLDPHAPSASGTVSFERVALAAFVPFLPSSIPFSTPERAHVGGHLVLETSDPDLLHADGTLRVEDLALSHPRIAAEPVGGIGFALEGIADYVPSAHRIAISELTLTMGRAHASLGGTLEWADDHYLIDGRATLPTTRCEDAVHAIPRDLLGDTASFHLAGQMGGAIAVHVDSRDLPHTTLSISVPNGCEFTAWPAMADTARFAGPFDHQVLEPDGSTFQMTTGPGTEAWTPIAEISPFLVHAVLAHEDASFFRHEGFATWAIREALIRDLEAGRYVAGGSTITMQLVKNVFLHREKTLARKIQEVLLTWWLETHVEKEQLLELYLNVIEYGPGVYGIRHAAEHYFGRSPADLSPAESAFLALILPNPPQFHEMYDEDEIPRSFRNRIASFVRTCGTRGRYDEAAVAFGVAEAETLSFHREGDPPPAPRTIAGAAQAIPEIQFFSTVPLSQLAGASEVGPEGTGDDDDDDAADDDEGGGLDGWDEDTWSP